MCGDGYESNGPSQQDGRESCDDGNQIDNDGCTNCKIDVGYEFVEWGKPC